MLSALALAAMVSLSKAERDAYYDKPPQNTLRDCGTEPQPYGECRLPPGLSAQDIETRLAGKNTAWWRDGDQFVIIARRDTDQAFLCCAARGRMDHIEGDLWAIRLRVVDLDHATIDISVRPSPDEPGEVYRGPAAPPPLVMAKFLQGRVHLQTIASKFLDAPRDVAIYVPPGYDRAKKYPVVYLADGNMSLDTPKVIEPLILSRALPPMILVELWAGQSDRDPNLRSEEYLPGWPNGGGAFLKHENFVLREVIPYVEQNYAASSDPKERIVTGFSSGAAWAIAMGLRHPDIFPTVIAQSLVWGEQAGASGSGEAIGMALQRPGLFSSATSSGWDELTQGLSDNTRARFYLTAGTLEPRFYEQTLRFAKRARSAGHNVELETTVSGHTVTIWPPLLVHALQWAFTGNAPAARAN